MEFHNQACVGNNTDNSLPKMTTLNQYIKYCKKSNQV